MMLNSTGYNYKIYRRTTNWRIVVLCISSFLHAINSSVSPCINGDCNEDSVQILKEEQQRIQKREHELIKKQKEVQSQLQKLYLEQQMLQTKSKNYPELNSDFSLEYEIPSYCANCLGDIFETTSKTLSSEFSREGFDGADMNNLRENNEMSQLSDHSRLEAIKFQILLKLGLKTKPTYAPLMTKQFILDTLRRSGDPLMNSNDFRMMIHSDSHEPHHLALNQLKSFEFNNHSFTDDNKTEETQETDFEQDFEDFYGSTREIIAFAEKGKKKF